ncbi:MAG: hypothetical protein BWY85_00777 [Firmicutes bacterium ADurb.Bin506]|nr:MAG: hypothetical protein BWY85_00777 [Firmicutes bacterium ADurb.Bin506]
MSPIVTFATVHQALKCENVLGTDGVGVRLMPVPRRLSSSCGLCAEIAGLDATALCARLEAAGIEYEAVYRMGDKGPPELVASMDDNQ